MKGLGRLGAALVLAAAFATTPKYNVATHGGFVTRVGSAPEGEMLWPRLRLDEIALI
jgi:hypothetical protein